MLLDHRDRNGQRLRRGVCWSGLALGAGGAQCIRTCAKACEIACEQSAGDPVKCQAICEKTCEALCEEMKGGATGGADVKACGSAGA